MTAVALAGPAYRIAAARGERMMAEHVLVVDDEPDIRGLVQEILTDEGYEVSIAADADSARQQRRLTPPDLVLLDIWMPGEDGVSLLKDWQETEAVACPVIMISGHGTVETAVEATRLGAYDFIEKPLTLAKLLRTVRRALEADQRAKAHKGLPQHGQALAPVGSSAASQQLIEQAGRIAERDSWVTILGEPGTGKETLARYIHSLSQRREQPFVAVGPGSFSGVDATVTLCGSALEGRVQRGLLEQAHGGVLFLDEVSDLDDRAQSSLQNALEGVSFVRVGDSQPFALDVRIIAASHTDLQQEVSAGRFREDLYYQLHVVPLALPPLRERGEDIPDLLSHYVNYYCSKEGFPYRHFTIAAQNRLLHHTWPGNERELRNLVQRLLILGTGEEIGVAEVEAELEAQAQPEASEADSPWQQAVFDLPLREAREAFERSYLLYQLKHVGGSVSKLSTRVGMERTHLYRKLRSLGINPKEPG